MIAEIAKGLGVTFKWLTRKPVTYQYPEVPKPVHRRFRGRHELKRWEDGLEKCIGCSLCAAACPADAIFVEPAENTDDERYAPGERYARKYEINMLRCIFCGYCEDACPTGAIILENNYELSGYDREGFLYTRDVLLVPPPAPDQDTPRRSEAKSYVRIGQMSPSAVLHK